MGKADFHVHSTYSRDGTTNVRAVLKRASTVGLDVVAITDHDDLRGSLTACELAGEYGVEAIPGVEVSSSDGHILALFVRQPIPAGRPLIETLLRIRDQGGIAVAPHPVNPLPKSLSMEALVGAVAHEQARHVLKGIEVYTMGYQIFNRLAQNSRAGCRWQRQPGAIRTSTGPSAWARPGSEAIRPLSYAMP